MKIHFLHRLSALSLLPEKYDRPFLWKRWVAVLLKNRNIIIVLIYEENRMCDF